MTPVQPVSSLNIDGNVLQVADLGPKVQNLLTVYNSWNQKLADAQEQFALVQAALNDLSRQIIVQIKQDAEEAKKAANDVAPAVTTPDIAAVTSDVPSTTPVTTPDVVTVTTPTAKE